MIAKISRGARMSGLLTYLVGPGEENEHEHPHIVAGHRSVTGLGYTADLSHDQALAVAREIDAPRRAARNVEVPVPNYLRDATGTTIVDANGRPVLNPLEPKRDGNVWHASLSLHAEEGQLTDEKWARIAEEFMSAMGFTAAAGSADARWVAVRHGLSARGNDHIHIAASAVRENGEVVNTYGDFARAQNACKELEQRHGLRVVLGRHDGRTARGYHRAHLYAAARAAGVQRGEARTAMRTGVIEPPRDRLERVVRACLAASTREADFVRTLRSQGVLVRRSRDPETGEVRGWCAGLRPGSGHGGGRRHRPPMPGGGSIAPDLTLPRLRHNWRETAQSRAEADQIWQDAEDALARYLTGDESAIPEPVAELPEPVAQQPTQTEINAAIQELERWANRVNAIPATDTIAFTAAARQAAGVFSALSLAHEDRPGPMAGAARTLSTYARVPAYRDGPVPDSFPLGGVAGCSMLLLAARRDANPLLANMALLHQIGRTVDAISRAAMAAGEAGRARELASLSVRELDDIHRRFATGETTARSSAQQAIDAARIADTAHGDRDRPRPAHGTGTDDGRRRPTTRRARPTRRAPGYDLGRFMGMQRPTTGPGEHPNEDIDPDAYGNAGEDTDLGAGRSGGERDRSAESDRSAQRPHERPDGPPRDIGHDRDR